MECGVEDRKRLLTSRCNIAPKGNAPRMSERRCEKREPMRNVCGVPDRSCQALIWNREGCVTPQNYLDTFDSRMQDGVAKCLWKKPRTIRQSASRDARHVYPCNEDCSSKLIRQPCACVTRSWSIGHQLLRELASSGAYAVYTVFIRNTRTIGCPAFRVPIITGIS